MNKTLVKTEFELNALHSGNFSRQCSWFLVAVVGKEINNAATSFLLSLLRWYFPPSLTHSLTLLSLSFFLPFPPFPWNRGSNNRKEKQPSLSFPLHFSSLGRRFHDSKCIYIIWSSVIIWSYLKIKMHSRPNFVSIKMKSWIPFQVCRVRIPVPRASPPPPP